MQSDGPVLTIDALLDMASRMEAIGPHRIISGAPIVASDRALEFLRRRVLFVGDGVIDELRRDVQNHFPEIAAAKVVFSSDLTMFGIPIEPYGSRPDHAEIMRDCIREMMGTPGMLLDDLREPPVDIEANRLHVSTWYDRMALAIPEMSRGFATMSIACLDASDAISQLTDVIRKASHDMDRKPASRRSIGRRKW